MNFVLTHMKNFHLIVCVCVCVCVQAAGGEDGSD